MAAIITKVPQFRRGEKVRFVGGFCTIKSYQLEADSWIYAVEMAMGPEPTMGRIGYETTVLLDETDLTLQTATLSSRLAISA
ncbi:MAG: hypothetical protein JOZ78_06890 [Chroococcidiopsidaceae cyanobacterium CP_BM_ER_R8_30]|nr:hypothetical protein [Chroococcidiopsidaceae cyanobacterium CP_BM_ER_R8_30]